MRAPPRRLGLADGDRRAVTRVLRVAERGERLGAEGGSESDDLRVARDDPDAVEARGAEGCQDVA